MTVKSRRMPYPVDNPPAGTRLMAGMVAAKYQVSVRDLGNACGMPTTTTFRALTNDWPARMNEADREQARQAMAALLKHAGATEEELAMLWHAHSRPNKTLLAAMAAVGAAPAVQTPAKSTHPTESEEPEMLLPKQALSPQARRAWKLFTNPFDGEVTNDKQMFDSGEVRYVRESVWQCAQNGGFVALVGESGAGKTTIQTDLEARLLAEARNVIVIKPSVLGMEETNAKGQMLKSTDILHAIITTLQPGSQVPQTLQARTVLASRMLSASSETGTVHLLVIEEAHGLPDETLKHLKRLHELRLGRRPLLGILLIAQPELKLRLANGLRTGKLREVAQRCEIVELLPLDSDLRAYLDCRCTAAGASLDDLLEQRAVDALRMRLTRKTASGKVSMCYPLAVHNMLTKALNRAADLGLPKVSAELINEL